MWNPSTWASFPLFENFPAVFHFSKYKFILFKHNSELLSALSLPFYTLVTAARVLVMKTFITTLLQYLPGSLLPAL